jgi:hypothetical protein
LRKPPVGLSNVSFALVPIDFSRVRGFLRSAPAIYEKGSVKGWFLRLKW